MRFTPKTEEQLADEALLPEGTYDFEVIDTNDKPSKKGNDMITLQLCVFDGDGSHRYVYDYIAIGNSFGERKLRHAANTCGLMDEYSSGNISASDFHGKTGKVLLKKQPAKDDFPPKNTVADYIIRDEGVTDTRTPRQIINDDIPF